MYQQNGFVFLFLKKYIYVHIGYIQQNIKYYLPQTVLNSLE